jgi:flagellar biogenesis protein FliO
MNGSIIILIVVVIGWIFERLLFQMKRERRRAYYREEYLKSDA